MKGGMHVFDYIAPVTGSRKRRVCQTVGAARPLTITCCSVIFFVFHSFPLIPIQSGSDQGDFYVNSVTRAIRDKTSKQLHISDSVYA